MKASLIGVLVDAGNIRTVKCRATARIAIGVHKHEVARADSTAVDRLQRRVKRADPGRPERVAPVMLYIDHYEEEPTHDARNQPMMLYKVFLDDESDVVIACDAYEDDDRYTFLRDYNPKARR